MKYSTLVDVAFIVEHDSDDSWKIPPNLILEAMHRRLQYLASHPDEISEAFGISDTYEIQPELLKIEEGV